MHECVSCSIRNSIAYITNEMLQHDEAFRSSFVFESQTYPKLTTAQLGAVLVGPDTDNLQSSGPDEIDSTAAELEQPVEPAAELEQPETPKHQKRKGKRDGNA